MLSALLTVGRLVVGGLLLALRMAPYLLEYAPAVARYIPSVARAVATIVGWSWRHPWLALGSLVAFENRDLIYDLIRSAFQPQTQMLAAPVMPAAPAPVVQPSQQQQWQQLFGPQVQYQFGG